MPRLVWWSIVVIALAFIFVTLVYARFAHAEICRDKIDPSIVHASGFRWQLRMIDGKRCWYYSNRVLTEHDLVWGYDSHNFDGDVTVLGRKFYDFIMDENGLLLELRERK